jgi:hypothetical protein
VVPIRPAIALGALNESMGFSLRVQVLVERPLQSGLAALRLGHLMAIERNVIRRLFTALEPSQHCSFRSVRSILPETIALRARELIQVSDDRAKALVLGQPHWINEADRVAMDI